MAFPTPWPSALGACVVLAVSACASSSPPAAPVPVDTVVIVDTVQVAGDPEEDPRVASLELQLLERQAQVLALNATLDETRREVVRSMARLQSLASRAEAASAIAEAEVALRELRTRGGREAVPEIAEAQRLFSQSSAEFDNQNFGGALYLANQAKNIAAAGRSRLAEVGTDVLRAGEVRFAVPVPLETTTRANVRDGPGTEFPVLFTLDAAVRVTGQSYEGEWVHIADATGRGGWIQYRLVRAVR